ncbi:hypothetical protein Q5H93_13795 [Hymenobacter sp. ASUV-10]|uniref:DUF4292 domain-containing protein n=1 Tax=Hymenobacter aranciens TaxID=3063996 RepID=A0ABT9BC21_9BACT|nr:hypothetical protein [Hymenobacter sp. ASUV-10]MDO7875811.1 hypothetical protein [Hymenobacter sp. ASUV-10]
MYEELRSSPESPKTLAALKPEFTNALYRTQVDIMGKPLSGLLLIKALPDGSTRVVFTNEIGVKFFDFSFGQQKFEVISCIDQLNKKAVINQLRQDIGAILMYQLDFTRGQVYQLQDELYYQFPGEKSTRLYYVTDAKQRVIKRIENTTDKKKKLVVELFNPIRNVADSIFLDHKLYKFSISLKKIKQ